LSNGAALCGREYGYVVWGVDDTSHEIIGTTVNFDKDIDHEPYKHYLARNLKPSVTFEVEDVQVDGKRLVLLTVPAAKSVPTKFLSQAFIRIGSSKEKLAKFPEWEIRLLNVLSNGIPTIVNTAAPDYAQELTFEKLFMYYGAKGIELRRETFKKSLKLLTADGRYNIMALLLSDANDIPIRVSVFSGKSKADALFSVKEYGNSCILYAMDKILEYGDAINIIQADERGRISERKDVPLFDYEAFHEAILNAFIHNKWLGLNAPMISVFTDRIEILSHGGIGLEQDMEGFFNGVSIPVNEVLASIFLQLRLSERSGRGVPKIVGAYGRESIRIEKNFIVVTIPFNRINVTPFELNEGNPTLDPTLDPTLKPTINPTLKLTKVQSAILGEISKNPNITQAELASLLKYQRSYISESMSKLQTLGILKRVGGKKTGYWEIMNNLDEKWRN
jgi:predicted HTH transcriptional regulator